jgi:hypothetical protein
MTLLLKGAMSLGLTLVATFLIVDLLFPGTTHIVNNIAYMVKAFIGHGLVGLITLLFFVSLLGKE